MPPKDTILDFRSDTVTKPSAAMREAMSKAVVGDDVLGDDPTVQALEREVAERFSREAALFVPSGTMANLIALGLHAVRGGEVILERRTHSFAFESAGAAAIWGLSFQAADGQDGILSEEQIRNLVRPMNIHAPLSRLLVQENTSNIAGGLVIPLATLKAQKTLARELGLAFHIDGARIWNAAAFEGLPLSDYGAVADTLSCCLSKGLGCPVGSLLLMDNERLEQARRLRKMLGGGMRQAGILAACGLWALEHNLPRLQRDHDICRALAQGLAEHLDQRFRIQPPQTNILLVHTDAPATTQSTLAAWEQLGIQALSTGPISIRLVTHLDIPDDGAEQALARIRKGGRP